MRSSGPRTAAPTFAHPPSGRPVCRTSDRAQPDADRVPGGPPGPGGPAVRPPAAARRPRHVAPRRAGPPAGRLRRQRAPRGRRARRGAERAGEGPGELRGAGAQKARAPGPRLCEPRLGRLAAARGRAQGPHLVGGGPRRVVPADARRLGDGRGAGAVVLHSAEAPEPAHGAHLERVDRRGRVAPGDQERVGRHPVVPRGPHAHEDARRPVGHPPRARPRAARTRPRRP